MPWFDIPFYTAIYDSEYEACKALEKWRWPEGIRCPYCQSTTIGAAPYSLGRPRRRYVHICLEQECGREFSVRSGTIMHSTSLWYRQWAAAFYIMAKWPEVTALQLGFALGISERTAYRIYALIKGTRRDDMSTQELQAINDLEKQRWPDGPVCPRCGSTRLGKRSLPDRLRCLDCRLMFNVKHGTVLQGSRMSYHQLATALAMMQADPTLSGQSLAEAIGVSGNAGRILRRRILSTATSFGWITPKNAQPADNGGQDMLS